MQTINTIKVLQKEINVLQNVSNDLPPKHSKKLDKKIKKIHAHLEKIQNKKTKIKVIDKIVYLLIQTSNINDLLKDLPPKYRKAINKKSNKIYDYLEKIHDKEFSQKTKPKNQN